MLTQQSYFSISLSQLLDQLWSSIFNFSNVKLASFLIQSTSNCISFSAYFVLNNSVSLFSMALTNWLFMYFDYFSTFQQRYGFSNFLSKLFICRSCSGFFNSSHLLLLTHKTNAVSVLALFKAKIINKISFRNTNSNITSSIKGKTLNYRLSCHLTIINQKLMSLLLSFFQGFSWVSEEKCNCKNYREEFHEISFIKINIIKQITEQLKRSIQNFRYFYLKRDFVQCNKSTIYQFFYIPQMIHQKISENQDNLKHLKVIKLLLKKEQQRSNKKTEQSKKRRKNLSKQLNLNTNKSFLQLSFRISYRNNSINLQNNNRIKKMRNTIENIVLGQKLAEIGQIQKTERTKNKQNIAKNISKDHRTERKSIKNGNLSTKKQLKISQGYKKYRDYRYYISQIEQYMQRVKQQNANIFIDHLLLAMYQYKSYRYVIMPENPMQSINVDLNEKYFQYTHAPYERSLLLSKTACGVRLNSRLTRTKKRNQENQTNKSVNSSLNKEFTRRNCDNLPINTTNPNKFIKLNRNILLFDLDQTLIHSLTKFDQHSHPGQQIYPQMDNSHPKLEQCEIYITKNQMKTEKMNKMDQDSNHFEEFQEKINKINICSNLKNRTWGKPQGIFVNIRPHAKQMLRRLSDHFIMGIFTAAQQTYANQILKILDPSSKIFSIKLFRQHCINLSSLSFISPNTLSSTTFSENVKDLRILSYDNCRLSASNVILVDNSPLSYLFQPDNGVPIIPFTNNPLDNQLLRLERFLYENLRDCADVRDIISNWFGTKYYQNFKSIREIVDKIYNNVQKNQF